MYKLDELYENAWNVLKTYELIIHFNYRWVQLIKNSNLLIFLMISPL